MKFTLTLLTSIILLASCANSQEGSQGEKQKETFTVYGNCGMCKKTIESSLEDVAGVNSADWEIESHQMSVQFNPSTITLDEIKQLIADVGYDSDSHRAKDEVYNNLHGCCQYERP
jgi:copper chaperone CopZ